MTTTPGRADRLENIARDSDARDPDARDPDARDPDARDRDGSGRARNARPRDSLGRPLPYGSPDVARQPEGIVRTPEETIAEAQRLLDQGLPFHAHEVFEDAWKSSDGADRPLWKGLAQLAVGLTHLARGNQRGARTLLRRGSQAISAVVDTPPYGIDIAGIMEWAAELTVRLDRSESTEPSILPAFQLRSG